jgi:hypothetical protein
VGCQPTAIASGNVERVVYVTHKTPEWGVPKTRGGNLFIIHQLNYMTVSFVGTVVAVDGCQNQLSFTISITKFKHFGNLFGSMIDIIELVEENLESMLNSGEIECPSEECNNRRFRVDIWQDDDQGIVGDACCRDCDLQIRLDLSDEPINEAESKLEEVETELHRQTPPKTDGKQLEAVE